MVESVAAVSEETTDATEKVRSHHHILYLEVWDENIMSPAEERSILLNIIESGNQSADKADGKGQ